MTWWWSTWSADNRARRQRPMKARTVAAWAGSKSRNWKQRESFGRRCMLGASGRFLERRMLKVSWRLLEKSISEVSWLSEKRMSERGTSHRSCRSCSYVLRMTRAHSLTPERLWVWVWVWDSWIGCAAAVARLIVTAAIRRNVSFNHKRDQEKRTE